MNYAIENKLSILPLLATLTLAFGQAAVADDDAAFQTVMHARDFPGAIDIEQGRFERGIARLEARLANGRLSHSVRVPLQIDLCAAYTVNGQLDKAETVCNQAVDSGWYSGMALNNRGDPQIAKGNHAVVSYTHLTLPTTYPW